MMKETRISVPELALVAGTRVALGAGIGLLVADCLSPDQRRGAGWALLLVGALTTIPLAFEVLGKERRSSATDERGRRPQRSSMTSAEEFSAELEAMAHA
jgi:hypothetical protein